MKHHILFSGGVDSLATAMELQRREAEGSLKGGILLHYVDLGTPYSPGEMTVVAKLAKELRMGLEYSTLTDIGKLQQEGNAYIPFRNLYLFMVVTGRLELVYGPGTYKIYMGGLRDDRVIDNCPMAYDHYQRVLSAVSDNDIMAHSLWWNHTKYHMVTEMHQHFGDEWVRLSRISMSCFNGDHCGNCPSCFRKWAAYEAAGISTEGWFKEKPEEGDVAAGYASKMVEDTGYDETRRDVTIKVLKQFGVMK